MNLQGWSDKDKQRMDLQPLLELFDREMRIEIEPPGARREVLPGLVRWLHPAPRINTIIYSRLEAGELDAVAAAQVEELSRLGQPIEWMVYEHDRPTDLIERLAKHGFAPDPEPGAVMVLDLQQAPDELLAPVEVDVRPVTRPEQLDEIVRIEESVWGGKFDWLRQRLAGEMALPGYLNAYIAYAGDEPACAGWVFFYPGSQFAGLYGGSTRPEFRKRGLYTGLLATRVQEALRRGRRYLFIDASPMSQAIVAHHGFFLLTHSHACDWKAKEKE